MPDYELRWLFMAIYDDGSAYVQNREDRPILQPNGSSFSDVDQSRLVAFRLVQGSRMVEVDLRDGCFSVDSVRFTLEDQTKGEGPYRLVYNRRVLRTLVPATGEETVNALHYAIGWERSDGNGGVIRRVMEVL